MASQRTRPAGGPLRSTTQNSISPSAKRRVERRLAEYEEFIDDGEGSYRHDPAREAPAELPIYHSEFLKAASACLKMQPDFLAAAKADKNPHLATALRNKTQDVLKDYQSKPESVAVVGKIGQGKSRLVDALLGIDQIAKSRRLKTAAKSPIYPADITELWCKIAPFANDQTTNFGTELEFNATLLVAKIEIFGDFRIPCSIGDCPGLEDINEGRVTKAKNYLQNCKVVIVVEDIFNSTIVAVGQCTGNVSR
ncbi:hypothetical protein IG631_08130 [Alternaria alternata]|nr:hypothetical protein IG631_08130 [Alternaria alternata]